MSPDLMPVLMARLAVVQTPAPGIPAPALTQMPAPYCTLHCQMP